MGNSNYTTIKCAVNLVLKACFVLCSFVLICVLAGPNLIFAQSTSIRLPNRMTRQTNTSFTISGVTNKNAVGRSEIPSTFSADAIRNHDRLYGLQTNRLEGRIPLVDLCRELNSLRFQVHLDEHDLDENGLSSYELVQLDSSVHSLGERVEFGLAELDLGFAFIGDVILIASMEKMEYMNLSVTYDITDLNAESSELIYSIESSIDALSWEDNGGPTGATINAVEVKGRNILTVSAPSHLQLKVRDYLNSLNRITGPTANLDRSKSATQSLGGSSTPVELPAAANAPTSGRRILRNRPNGSGKTKAGGIF